MAELERVKPTHVLNCAAARGGPRRLVRGQQGGHHPLQRHGTLNLADVCFQAGVHCTVFATGCIYQYDDAHPIGGPGFLETDKANFDGSFYSETKAHVEEGQFLPLSSCAVLCCPCPSSPPYLSLPL